MYARQVRGMTLTFGVSGKLVRNSLIMFDRQTGSLWSHLLGTAISGPLQGAQLEIQPSTQTTWALWRREHPETVVLSDAGSAATGDPYASYYASGDFGVLGRKHEDGRLDGKARVLGVRIGGQVKAYSFTALGRDRVVDDQLGGVPLVLVFDPGSDSGAVYRRDAGGRALRFRPGAAPLTLRDEQTGSMWDGLAGRATAGPLAGTTLDQVPVTYSFWFGWADFYPGTQLYR